MLRKLLLLKLILLSLSVSLTSWSDNYDELLGEMQSIKANEGSHQAAIAAGQDRSLLCGYCHGKDGNSVKNYIPNLAQQNPEYLLKQFQLFATGERKNYVMQQLAEALTPQERIDIALYFSSQKVAVNDVQKTSKEGQERYQSFCFACHGESGLGNKDLPRLAGQKKDFLVKTLNGFKHGEKSRSKSPMVKIMRAVQESEIEPLAIYISNMQ
mgnify:CR=1 FL=1